MRTLDERERLAYIEGRAHEAALLGELMDGQAEGESELQCQIEGLKEEIDSLNDSIVDLEDQLDACDCDERKKEPA